jgi:hypothetical protein
VPVAVPLPLVSPAADDAVHTDLPAPESVVAAEPPAHLRHDPQRAGGNTSKHVLLDQGAGTIVYQVVDNRTSLVLRQFPEQGFLRRRAYSRALAQAREDAIAQRIDRKV